MKARVLDNSEEKTWEKFVEKHTLGTIHQSPAWGHFQAKIPARGKYWIVVLEDEGKIIGGTMLIRHKTHGDKTWLYAARGPLLDYKNEDAEKNLKKLTNEIKKIAKEENAIFLRIDPPVKELKKQKEFSISHNGFQPETTLILDIGQSEEDILKQMKPKGRYNIRLATKKGVTIREADPKNAMAFKKDIDAYQEILKETTTRDGFHGHKKQFYYDMVETLAISKSSKMYIAEYEGEVVAALIATFFKDTAIYYYGVSSNKYRNVMAPYLLQWHTIKEAKKAGYTKYDFFGIAPEGAKNHPWKGVTDFKKKFGGAPKSYTAPQEYPFQKFTYLLYRLYKWLKK